MKKLLMSFLSVLLMISCGAITNPIEDDTSSRTFKISEYNNNLSASTEKSIKMKLMISGENVIIYADTRYLLLDSIPEANWKSVASEFDKYYSKIIDVYGTHTDVDKNGKVILLFHIMPNGLGGYFTGADLFEDFGRNNAEVVNINLDFVASHFDIAETMDTVFHEFQHLINFNMTIIASKFENIPSLWLNEVLSESVYFVYQNGKPNLTRFSPYNGTNIYSKKISEGANFFAFNGVESYITGSMFMYWLYQHGGGNTILKAIAQGDNNYDFNAVVNAVKRSSTFTLALGANPQWSDILVAWLEANYVNDKSSIKGYKGKYTFTPKQVKGKSRVNLLPGGAVYTSASATSASGNIAVKNVISGANTWQIVYNKDSSTNETTTSANVAWLSLEPSDSLFSIRENSNEPLSRKYWVDIVQ